MVTVCVYLGANFGNNEAFEQATIKLAHALVDRGLSLVYGGSRLGLMGLLALTVKALGGKVVGVTTSHLHDKELPLAVLDELHIVNTMSERKKIMQQRSDIFIVMPGGLGTLEEALETWNAIKIGEINKKIGFLNVENYFDLLFDFVERCQHYGFIHQSQAAIPLVASDPYQLLANLTQPLTS